MNFFHRHKFDPEKWKLISEVPTERIVQIGYMDTLVPSGKTFTYTNTCTACGDIVFRTKRDIA